MHNDTVRLLGECAVGLGRTVLTMEELLPEIKDHRLRGTLRQSCREYAELLDTARQQLSAHGQLPIKSGRAAAWLLANTKMALRHDDMTAAYVVAEACDRDIKNLCRSRNRYNGAAVSAVDLAQQLIDREEKLSAAMRPFL